MTEYLYLFDSTHQALKAEKVLKEKNFQIWMVPIPPEISADCGIAIKFYVEPEVIEKVISSVGIITAGCYQIDNKGLTKL